MIPRALVDIALEAADKQKQHHFRCRLDALRRGFREWLATQLDPRQKQGAVGAHRLTKAAGEDDGAQHFFGDVCFGASSLQQAVQLKAQPWQDLWAVGGLESQRALARILRGACSSGIGTLISGDDFKAAVKAYPPNKALGADGWRISELRGSSPPALDGLLGS